jgi:hypothetical protein
VFLAHFDWTFAPIFNKKNMKLKAIVMILLGIIITSQAYAIEKEQLTKSHQSVLDCFMKSYLNTDYKLLKQVLSQDATFTTNRAETILNHKANEVLDFMKKNNGAVQGHCTIDSTILCKTDVLVIARVDVHYELFEGDQQNFVIMEKNKAKEWKITKVYKMYVAKQKEEKIVAK